MREIKFRVLDKDLNKFISPYAANVRLELETGSIYYNGTDLSEYYELLQYTGLKDRHGVEIYEGDILTHDGYENGVCKHTTSRDVESERDSFISCFGIECCRGYFRSFCNVYDPTRFMSVIGNIYENPELLK